MKIKFTEFQLNTITAQVNILREKEKELRKKQKTEHVNGWDFVAIENEIAILENFLEKEAIDTNRL